MGNDMVQLFGIRVGARWHGEERVGRDALQHRAGQRDILFHRHGEGVGDTPDAVIEACAHPFGRDPGRRDRQHHDGQHGRQDEAQQPCADADLQARGRGLGPRRGRAGWEVGRRQRQGARPGGRRIGADIMEGSTKSLASCLATSPGLAGSIHRPGILGNGGLARKGKVKPPAGGRSRRTRHSPRRPPSRASQGRAAPRA